MPASLSCTFTAVNALSSWAVVQVKQEGAVHEQRYERGIPMGPVAKVGKVAALP